MPKSEDGFTLIELLVVILIIAILAAIAIPVFLAQRQKGWEADVQSALKNVAIAIESYGIDQGGFGNLNADPQLATKLAAQGFRIPNWAAAPGGYFQVQATATHWCVQVQHKILPVTSPWYRAIHNRDAGVPQASPDTC